MKEFHFFVCSAGSEMVSDVHQDLFIYLFIFEEHYSEGQNKIKLDLSNEKRKMWFCNCSSVAFGSLIMKIINKIIINNY